MADATLALGVFGDQRLHGEILAARLTRLRDYSGPRLARFMGYYRNPTSGLAELLPGSRGGSLAVRPYRQYQEVGLPTRITGFRVTGEGVPVLAGPLEAQRKEVVIENDLAWRINTQVDFAVGQMPVLASTAADPARRALLPRVLNVVLGGNGGAAWLQELTLLGAIHGSAYVVIHPSEELLARMAGTAAEGSAAPALPQSADGGEGSIPAGSPGGDGAGTNASVPPAGMSDAEVVRLAEGVRLEIVEAGRVLAILDGATPRSAPTCQYAAILHEGQGESGESKPESTFQRVARWLTGSWGPEHKPAANLSFDFWGSAHWQRYVGGERVDEAANPLGFVPVVAFINQVTPRTAAGAGGWGGSLGGGLAAVEGLSDVEPLIGLQDELNTRLSDRANRVTMQSFRMYLANPK